MDLPLAPSQQAVSLLFQGIKMWMTGHQQ